MALWQIRFWTTHYTIYFLTGKTGDQPNRGNDRLKRNRKTLTTTNPLSVVIFENEYNRNQYEDFSYCVIDVVFFFFLEEQGVKLRYVFEIVRQKKKKCSGIQASIDLNRYCNNRSSLYAYIVLTRKSLRLGNVDNM